MTVVRLMSIDKRPALVQDIVIVDSTLLLDVKSNVSRSDIGIANKTSWLDKQIGKVKSCRRWEIYKMNQALNK